MIEIDARGLRCPWPALRLARALRDAGEQSLTVLADDPAAARELAAVATAAGRTLRTLQPHRFSVTCASDINGLFTADP